jgi:hypothetical protein
MNTQRREKPSAPASENDGRGARNRWQRSSCTQSAEVSGPVIPAPIARNSRALATDGTAPPVLPARWVTNSLQSEQNHLNFVTPAWFVPQDSRRSLPPPGAGIHAATGTLTTRRSSSPFIPSPSGFVSIHPTSPQFPVGFGRWTERYDGKRDLYLQHAA